MHGEKTVNPSIKTYVNKLENKIPFKIKTWYYLELSTHEIMKLIGSAKSKVTKMQMAKMSLIWKLLK